MIDEKNLKEDLNKWFEVITKYCNKFNYHDALERYEEAYYIFADIIESQPKLSLETKTSDWIPFDKQLPPKPEFSEQGYIVQVINVEEPFSAYWNGEKWTDEWSENIYGVIAWMPLPDAYKGEE